MEIDGVVAGKASGELPSFWRWALRNLGFMGCHVRRAAFQRPGALKAWARRYSHREGEECESVPCLIA